MDTQHPHELFTSDDESDGMNDGYDTPESKKWMFITRLYSRHFSPDSDVLDDILDDIDTNADDKTAADTVAMIVSEINRRIEDIEEKRNRHRDLASQLTTARRTISDLAEAGFLDEGKKAKYELIRDQIESLGSLQYSETYHEQRMELVEVREFILDKAHDAGIHLDDATEEVYQPRNRFSPTPPTDL